MMTPSYLSHWGPTDFSRGLDRKKCSLTTAHLNTTQSVIPGILHCLDILMHIRVRLQIPQRLPKRHPTAPQSEVTPPYRLLPHVSASPPLPFSPLRVSPSPPFPASASYPANPLPTQNVDVDSNQESKVFHPGLFASDFSEQEHHRHRIPISTYA